MTEADEAAETDGAAEAAESSHDEDHATAPGEYDPSAPTPPAREPPVRSTAPQSDYTMGQVATGAIIFLVGAALTFGLPLVMA